MKAEQKAVCQHLTFSCLIQEPKTHTNLKLFQKEDKEMLISVLLLSHWPWNSQGKNGACLVITPAMDN